MGYSYDKICCCFNYKKNNDLYNINIGGKNNKINNKNIPDRKRRVFNLNAGSKGNEINNDFYINDNKMHKGINELINCMTCSCGNKITNKNGFSKNINDLMCCSCGNKIENINFLNNDIYHKNNPYNNNINNINNNLDDDDDLFETGPIPMNVINKKDN